MSPISRRALLNGLTVTSLTVAGCGSTRRPDSRRDAWSILIDLSGTAVTERRYYVQELEQFVREIAELKPTVVVDIVGFSSFAKPLASGQAQLLPATLPDVIDAVQKWPVDPYTDFSAVFGVAHDLQRKRLVDRRVIWILSDGIHDPRNRWRTRPTVAVPLPKDLPLAAMKDGNTLVHWDAMDEYQLAGWQRVFEIVQVPAVFHLRGYVEVARGRLQRLPREETRVDASVDSRGNSGKPIAPSVATR